MRKSFPLPASTSRPNSELSDPLISEDSALQVIINNIHSLAASIQRSKRPALKRVKKCHGHQKKRDLGLGYPQQLENSKAAGIRVKKAAACSFPTAFRMRVAV